MKKLRFLILLLTLLSLCLAAGCGSQPKTNEPPPIITVNVSAASSLKDVLTELQREYQTLHPDTKLVFNFGASGALQQQIEQGAPADLFISAAAQQMDALQSEQLIIASSRRNLCQNELVLIAPADSEKSLTAFTSLGKPEIKSIALGELKTVPAGQYAKQLLQKLALWNKIESKIVYAKDVRAVLTYVETGNVDAGIVYKTDALNDKKVKIAALAQPKDHAAIVYPMALLTSDKLPQPAVAFMDFLETPGARQVFEKYGFSFEK